MHKLVLTLALVPALLATGARAQTVADDVAKNLWCAEAFTVLFESEKTQVPADQMAEFNALCRRRRHDARQGRQGLCDRRLHPGPGR